MNRPTGTQKASVFSLLLLASTSVAAQPNMAAQPPDMTARPPDAVATPGGGAPAQGGSMTLPRVLLQTGDHGDHTRLVLTMPAGSKARFTPEGCGGRLALDHPAAWPVDQINSVWTKRLSDFGTTPDNRSLSFKWTCGGHARVQKERNLLIVDVTDPPLPGRKPGSLPAPTLAPIPAVGDAVAAAGAIAPSAAAAAMPATPPPAAAPLPASAAAIAAALSPVGTAEAATALPAESKTEVKAAPEHGGGTGTKLAQLESRPALPAAPAPAPAGTLQQAVQQSIGDALRSLEATAPKPRTAPAASSMPAAEPPVPSLPPFDVPDWAGAGPGRTRQELESALAAAKGRARVEALIALGRFSLANGLEEEGRASLESAASLAPAPDQRYQLQLLGDAFAALSGTADVDENLFVRSPLAAMGPDHHVWRSAALAPTRWPDAKRSLPIALKRLLAYPAELRARLFVVLARGAEESDAASLGLIVMAMITTEDRELSDGALDYFRGRLAELQERPDEALDHYRRAGALPGPFGHRALLHSVLLRERQGTLGSDGVIDELESLRFAWRGDDVEADALAGLGRAYLQAGKTDAALDMLGLLGRRFGATARGHAALTAGRDLLAAIVERLERDRSDRLNGLALHVRHGRLLGMVDGEDGTLQRRLARLLGQRGFTVESVKTLHALAERARGMPRAEIGAELARTLIDLDREEEALAVLDRTAATGLDAALSERRALLRGEALLTDADGMRVLDALRGLPGTAAARLRAHALLRMEEWGSARNAFAELVGQSAEKMAGEKMAGAGAVLPSDIAHLGIASFQAGDFDGLRRLDERLGRRLDGTAWEGLLQALSVPPGGPLSRETVSRQLAAADAVAGLARRWTTAPQP